MEFAAATLPPAGPTRRRPAPGGFTLVELLVVIGIVAVLVAILLPVLSRARDAANTVKCAANLHSIGQGIAAYAAESKGVLPASNTWKYLHVTADTQDPTAPSYGTIHWSSSLFADARLVNDGTDRAFRSRSGWEMFQCPSLPDGGLPPANTFPGNSDLPNEATGLDPYTRQPVIDAQAPRLAYTLNEALCPRTYLVAGAVAAGNIINPDVAPVFVDVSAAASSAGGHGFGAW